MSRSRAERRILTARTSSTLTRCVLLSVALVGIHGCDPVSTGEESGPPQPPINLFPASVVSSIGVGGSSTVNNGTCAAMKLSMLEMIGDEYSVASLHPSETLDPSPGIYAYDLNGRVRNKRPVAIDHVVDIVVPTDASFMWVGLVGSVLYTTVTDTSGLLLANHENTVSGGGNGTPIHILGASDADAGGIVLRMQLIGSASIGLVELDAQGQVISVSSVGHGDDEITSIVATEGGYLAAGFGSGVGSDSLGGVLVFLNRDLEETRRKRIGPEGSELSIQQPLGSDLFLMLGERSDHDGDTGLVESHSVVYVVKGDGEILLESVSPWDNRIHGISYAFGDSRGVSLVVQDYDEPSMLRTVVILSDGSVSASYRWPFKFYQRSDGILYRLLSLVPSDYGGAIALLEADGRNWHSGFCTGSVEGEIVAFSS